MTRNLSHTHSDTDMLWVAESARADAVEAVDAVFAANGDDPSPERTRVLTALEGVRFRLTNAVRTAGSAVPARGIVRVSRFHTDKESFRDTVMHELAHIAAGPGAGHGPAWKAWARAFGCSADRCFQEGTTICTDEHNARIRYIGTCESCGATVLRRTRFSPVVRQCLQGSRKTRCCKGRVIILDTHAAKAWQQVQAARAGG